MSKEYTDSQRFSGRTIVVTGAGSGIGRETALNFAREGGKVLASDINESAVDETARLICTEGGVAEPNVTDVSDSAAIQAMIADAVGTFGGLHVLHNNAYWAPVNHAVLDTPEDMWDRVINTTLKSVFLGAKHAIPELVKSGGGAIVNTASTAGVVASPKFGAYMAAKGGVISLTRSIAFDYGVDGIRCNAVAPGLIRTQATDPVFADPIREEWLTSRIVVGRVGTPSDIARAVLFLASDESDFISGQTLIVDGGRTIA